jgi:hypothetical protein
VLWLEINTPTLELSFWIMMDSIPKGKFSLILMEALLIYGLANLLKKLKLKVKRTKETTTNGFPN